MGEAPALDEYTCPHCGTSITVAADVCPDCGEPLAVAWDDGDGTPVADTVPLTPANWVSPTTLRAAARSHPGRLREANEDSVIFCQLSSLLAGGTSPQVGFYAVADGIGGHDRGEVASRRVLQQLAAAVLDRVFKRVLLVERPTDQAWMERAVRDCILAANAELLALQRANHSDMGTTLTAALIIDGRAAIANVGDSRTYLWRDGALVQVTRDHSLVASLIAAGHLAPEAIYTHDQKAMIYRSVGESDDLAVDVFALTLQPDDRLVLCSDGLWEMVRDEGLAGVLAGQAEPQAVCDQLVTDANRAGGEDNISVLVVWAAPGAE